MNESTKITEFMKKICAICYYCGIPNLWVSGTTKKYFNYLQILMTVAIIMLVIMECLSYITQTNLSEKQASDRFVFCFSHIIFLSYFFNVAYYKDEVMDLLFKLCVTLKKEYNEPEIERAMIRRSIFYSCAYCLFLAFALISYGFDALQQVVKGEGTFTIVVTVWPDITDTSTRASVFRVINYLLWWTMMTRVSAIYVTVICLTVTISHQYKNIQSYFYSLNDLFEDDLKSEEWEMREMLYEKSIKIGFRMHADTLWCAKKFQLTCNTVNSGHIIITVVAMCILLLQMVNSERTMMNAMVIVFTSAAVIFTAGFLMWNAGDITTEAALIPTAMFHSGWHRCRGPSAPRIRRMLITAIRQSQKPVVIRSFGIIELSYKSYLSIVKSSYSAFSLLY